ncbi:I78 family peptidase inhibitor [Terricaulis silvestris]|uniref:Peptidase inhibitor I78 family protein n=1 Tax=Terricaulis silvestris TaxID=2686094 RepID=A0A6I6MS67_9CAUL|nr:I78 family peptidase inhibitor [Terricaulis silvestris]QGZ95454.1 Peptidase inhibitor I78 family protein [Terricaulis silvestris]
MRLAGMLGALLLLGACATERTPTYRELERSASVYERGGVSGIAAPQNAEDATARNTCGARSFRDRIGTPVADMQVPASVRVIAPGTAVTDDFRSNRLNIITDEHGVIIALQCY